jgi:hypothetical protein
MTRADDDRIFGRGRLRMATGAHVEVFREAASPGERRRYTKRFLATEAGDFRHWTEREWRILARLFGHGVTAVPEVVRFERGSAEQPALVQTYDAGITLDHWTTLLPVRRSDDAPTLRHLFEDCAHWWALAHHCLVALDAVHALQLVHLDLKADNLCIPFSPADFDPCAADQRLRPRFERLALIDFAFALVSGEPLDRALPIARQPDFDYQSPRLLHALEAGARGDLLPTRRLDWRCDLYSLAAMLRRCLPDPEHAPRDGWNALRQTQARALVRRLLEAHDGAACATRPHAALLALTASVLDDAALRLSLGQGWMLAGERERADVGSPTPVTRIAPALGSVSTVGGVRSAGFALPYSVEAAALARLSARREARQRAHRWGALVVSLTAVAVAAPFAYRGGLAPSPGRLVAALPATDVAATVPAAQDARDSAAVQRRIEPLAPSGAETAGVVGGAATAGKTDPPVAVVLPASAPAIEERSPIPNVLPAPAAVRSAQPPIVIAASELPVAAPPERRAVVPLAAPSRTVPAAAARAAREPTRRVAALRMVEPRAVKVAPAAARTPVRSPTAVSERQRALAWLTLRGPSPRGSAALPMSHAMPAAGPPPAPSALGSTPPPTMRNTTAPPGGATTRTAGPATADARVNSAPAEPADRVSSARVEPAAVAKAPAEPPRAAFIEPAPTGFAARAEQLLATEMPPLAQRLERRVQHVMSLAAAAAFPGQDDEVRRAADALDDPAAERLVAGASARSEAQVLHEEARQALRRRGNPREAHALQMRAFGADPLDGDVAATLAFLTLKLGPAHFESARQLALYSLTLPGERSPAVRLTDWTTLAIASALTGRERDARRAWYVSLALAPQPERQCRAAINAYALRGEALRLSVEAMLYRAYESGRGQGSPLCEWPPNWLASGR